MIRFVQDFLPCILSHTRYRCTSSVLYAEVYKVLYSHTRAGWVGAGGFKDRLGSLSREEEKEKKEETEVKGKKIAGVYKVSYKY